ncbi:MAG: hypothetical protein KDB00_29455 [Planctomycetales bacterium]|nr:hypothetical protein [Planctomycetales bacterium]
MKLISFLELNQRDWELRDYWEDDLFAVGIGAKVDRTRLVYVCTFGRPSEEYYYECEVTKGEDDYESVASRDNVSKEELLKVLEAHLTG